MQCQACGGEYNFEICKGETFLRDVMWQAQPFVYKAIAAVVSLVPLRLNVIAHGMVQDQLAAISDIEGMVEANAPTEPPALGDFQTVTVLDADTLEFNTVDAQQYGTYVAATGYVRYFTLPDLTGYTARLDIRDKVGGTLLYQMSTTIGNIMIDNLTKKITLEISDTDTTAFTFSTGVYTLELESPTGVVTPILSGRVRTYDEVTITSTP